MTATLVDPAAALTTRMVIGSDLIDTASGGSFDPFNPATGRSHSAPVPRAGEAEVEAAVTAARAALPSWAAWSPGERSKVLLKLADLVRANRGELAVMATLETGVPISQTPWMVDYGIAWLEDAAGWPEKLYGEVSPVTSSNLTYTRFEPFGVIANIVTWNGTSGGFAMTVAPMLAAGCTVVVKPSELAPYASLRMGEICLEAGIPPGVVNVITGGPDTGDTLVRHPGISKVSFTGGGRAASAIAGACSTNLTPCVFELGGKSAIIVHDDADLERVVAAAMHLTFNAGQTCTVGSRFVVQAGIYDDFVNALGHAMSGVHVGDPFAESTIMGPLISSDARERTLELIERTRTESTLVTGGNRVTVDGSQGYYIEPTLFADVDNGSELSQTEVFGPVGAVSKFDTEEQAVAIANDTPYGLAGYVFTSDVSRAHRVAAALDAENVGVNGGTAPAGAQAPFGGRKRSGYGKQGGRQGLLEFLHTKTISINL